jgi:hypothetical protein
LNSRVTGPDQRTLCASTAPSHLLALWIGAAAIITAVAIIYAEAARSYFLDDDFHWLAQSQVFEPRNLLNLERYGGFYRPVIEIYFYTGLRLFECEALPFHLLSIAIHLLCTLVLFMFACSLTGNNWFALLSALFFSVQSSDVEAVTWVGAITDLLPALWYLLTLWMHLRFLQTRRVAFYVASLVLFVTCLLTHESSATLLPMMVILEISIRPGTLTERLTVVISRLRGYGPFALFLIGFLVVAYIVNSRHYVVREGYYAIGWHAISNVYDSIVAMYVGKRKLLSYVAISVVVAALLWRGGARVRFFVLWVIVTLLPAAFFTWGIASRYLYLPAAGFALLLASMVLHIKQRTKHWVSPWTADMIAGLLVCTIAIRFAVFAKEGVDEFRQRTLPYERVAAAVKASSRTNVAEGVVHVTAADVEDVPPLYRDAAAQVALCTPQVRLTLD